MFVINVTQCNPIITLILSEYYFKIVFYKLLEIF